MLFGGTMPTFVPGRRPMSPGNRAGLGAALAMLAIVSAVESVETSSAGYIGLFALVPIVGALFAVWQYVLGVGVAATVAGVVFVGQNGTVHLSGMVYLLGIVLATGIAVAVRDDAAAAG